MQINLGKLWNYALMRKWNFLKYRPEFCCIYRILTCITYRFSDYRNALLWNWLPPSLILCHCIFLTPLLSFGCWTSRNYTPTHLLNKLGAHDHSRHFFQDVFTQNSNTSNQTVIHKCEFPSQIQSRYICSYWNNDKTAMIYIVFKWTKCSETSRLFWKLWLY